MEETLKQIQTDYLEKINQADSLKSLDEIFIELFGKNGVLTLFPKEFPKLAKEELKVIAPLFSKTKLELEQVINRKRDEIREEKYKCLQTEKLELEIASASPRNDGEKNTIARREPEGLSASLQKDNKQIIRKREGHLHPLTLFENRIADLFAKLDFQQFDAPHIDTDYNVYEVLNIPKDSPARDLQDTLYIDTKKTKEGDYYILRGHTSNSEVRFMKAFKAPLRMMLIGRCFRYENLDPRHEHTFDQFEIVYIDKGVSMANLQYLSEYLLNEFFGTEIKARLRPKYYPQVEPGGGIDALCIFCKGKGCKVCSGVGWLEIGGCGMIHPVALKNGEIDTNKYSGLAWGISPMRMAMLLYGIDDIRLFNSGDLKFLQGFKGGKYEAKPLIRL